MGEAPMSLLLVIRRFSRMNDLIEGRISLNGREVGKITLRSRDWDALERGNVEVTVADVVTPVRARR
jgi:hypothetical protein